MTPTPCPTDDQLAQFADGKLSGTAFDELERHLDACATCRQLLAAVSNGSSPTARPERPTFSPGDTLGRYQIERLIAAGGMGMLYIAKDPQLGRRVALKLMRPSMAAAEGGRLRLLREAQTMAALAHPNVVNVYELGEVDGRVFVAMELVDGGTLRDWMKKPSTWKEVVAMFCAAGEGLAAAHRAGVVHRDFKPENVLVGSDGRPRVGDFGLARPELVAEEEAPLNSALPMKVTHTGTMLGTPAYMAPEQLAGRVADARSDQYGFCVSLYEALAGKRPFPADTLEELRARVEGGMPPPPKDGLVPAHVWAAIARGLNPSPAQRFPDMDALLTVLRFEGARAPQPRRSRPALLAAGAAAVLLLGSVGLLAQRSLSTEARAGQTSSALPAPPPAPPAPPNAVAPDEATAFPPQEPQATEPMPARVELESGTQKVFDVPAVSSVTAKDARVADVYALDQHQVLVVGGQPGHTSIQAVSSDGKKWEAQVYVTPAQAEPRLNDVALAVGEKKVFKVAHLQRVAVGDDDVMDMETIGDDQLRLIGKAPGRTTLVLWTTGGKRESYPVLVYAARAAISAVDKGVALPGHLVVEAGKQLTLRVGPMQRIAVGDTDIADVKTVGNDRLEIQGGSAGRTTLIVWAEDGTRAQTVIQVDPVRPAALPGELTLDVGAQQVLDIPGLTRVAVGDPRVLDVKAIGNNQLLLLGSGPGRTTVLVWTQDGKRLDYAALVRAAP